MFEIVKRCERRYVNKIFDYLPVLYGFLLEMTAESRNEHWSYGLIKTLSDPAQKVLEDDEVIVIKDLYPKATCHFLVCPKADIKDPKSLKPEHIPLLKHMESVGERIAEKHSGKKFLIGYHAVPSMSRLHLHVISDDFNSKCLKTKKHWNSFNTEFFIKSSVLIKKLESGKLKLVTNLKKNELLNAKLKCHKCEYYPKNMPDLKSHILRHS